MMTNSWVRVDRNPLHPCIQAFALLWVTGLFALLVGGPLVSTAANAGAVAAVALGVPLLSIGGYLYYRAMRWAWRVTGAGTFLSARGVRVRYLRTEVVIPWEEITGFARRRHASLAGSFGSNSVLWVLRLDGSAVPTGLASPRPPLYWGQKSYDRVVRVLQDELRRHTDGRPTETGISRE